MKNRVHFLVRDLLSVRIYVHLVFLNGVAWQLNLLWLSALSRGLVTSGRYTFKVLTFLYRDHNVRYIEFKCLLHRSQCMEKYNALRHFVILKLLKLSLHTIFMRAILSFQHTFCHYLIYDSSSYPNVKHTARLSKIPLKSIVRNRPR